ncbi:MAG: gliding motility-associated C-terminal domain-containing protein [Bacteroidales bacterium]|nr:gliding motility-associated C-terminal domain-containing protein [Bacteroidales bacterium]
MKKIYFAMLLLLSFVTVQYSYAQTTVKLDNSTDGTTKSGCNFVFVDNGGATGKYANSQDRSITFCPSSSLQRISVEFETFDLLEGDTMRIYQGTDLDAPVVINDGTDGFTGSELSGVIMSPPPTNATGCLTFRFTSDDEDNSAGWKAKITCENMCQDVIAALDTFYTRVDSLGISHDVPLNIEYDISTSKAVKHRADGSLIWDTIISGDTMYYDTVAFYAFNMCLGDSLMIMHAKPEFPYSDYTVPVTRYLPSGESYIYDSVVGYHQTPEDCIYTWSFGDEETKTVEYDPVVQHHYSFLQGYNLNLKIKDTNSGGCTSKNSLIARVRVAQNPIKTVAKMPDMCSGDKQQLFVGYSNNSSVIMDTIAFSQAAREEYDTRTFIPDGGYATGGSNCYEAPVTFTTFNPGATIDDPGEVLDVCISIEHSFIGDLGFWLICPNGQQVTLKYNTHELSYFLGQPLDGSGYDSGNIADTTANPPGVCWTYCFSNIYTKNGQGVIGTGNNHLVTAPYNNGTANSSSTIDSTHTADSSYYFQTPIQGLSNSNGSQQKTVDLHGFSSLVGCDLNGEWIIRVCDDWGADNGWICSWWMDLGKQSSTDWTYQVPIDTVYWDGPYIHPVNSTTGEIAPPIDASGTFEYGISIVDAFGCPWDTVTSLNVVRTPVIDLPNDTSFCEGGTMVLDAGNEGAFRYDWEPTGETTQQIVVDLEENISGLQQYIVMVTNYNGVLYCYGLDTVNITIDPPGLASFKSNLDYMEGCEPLQLQLESTTEDAEHFYWVVGDMSSTEKSPYFELSAGTYDLMLTVETDKGCRDTIKYEDIINVFKNPLADFGWDPALPYASNPAVKMINLTTPEISSNRYHWQFQTNKNDDGSIVNVLENSPLFNWTAQSGESVAGDYNVTLDAYTYNVSPSGRVYECHDTITKIITIINDNIMFPTVVTPNGDGINEIFYIHNLIDGQAFPDNELAIYNRYGKRIYYIQDLRTENDFWDPDKTNSPTGTYFYRFIGRGPIRNVEFKGSVEVLRDK